MHHAVSQPELCCLACLPFAQANAELVGSDPAVAEEFAAAPWLLPPRTPALPYAGVHDLDALLALRSRPAGRWGGSVTVLLFSKPYAVMVQNSSECWRVSEAALMMGPGSVQCRMFAAPRIAVAGPGHRPSECASAEVQVQTRATSARCSVLSTHAHPPCAVYSLVKHAGVRNYIAVAWGQEDLEACADLNLPCADVSSLLLEPISECLLPRNGSRLPVGCAPLAQVDGVAGYRQAGLPGCLAACWVLLLVLLPCPKSGSLFPPLQSLLSCCCSTTSS